MEPSEAKIVGATSTRKVLIVLGVPSADRDGKALSNQDEWKNKGLTFFGEAYGGCTAMPRAEGIWRDDDRGGNLVRDYPILLHCYVTEEQAQDRKLLTRLGGFCRRMGREMKQGEVGLLIDGQWHGFNDLS